MNYTFKSIKKTVGAVALFACVTMLPAPLAMAQDYNDIANHWAKNEISAWSEKGILVGFDNQFRPNGNITRGEMAVILNEIMDYQRIESDNFTDLDEKFYADALRKANTANILAIEGTEIRPTEAITRQEAAVMIAKALNIEPNASPDFLDNDDIADWAKEYIGAMQAKGYVSGYEGNFNPNSTITRAETVMILDMMIAEIYNTAGTYTASSDKAVIINTSGVILQNGDINGSLIISEGVKDGDVTLENIKVSGKTFINGGGENTVKAINSELNDVDINNQVSNVRLLTSGSSTVKNVTVETPVTLEGSFQAITSSANTTIKGNADSLVVSKTADIRVASGAVGEITVEKAATGTAISGEGKVTSVQVNASNTNVSTKGSVVSTATDVTNVTNNGQTVKPGSNTTGTTTNENANNSNSSSSSNNSGGSSSSSSSSASKLPTITSVESIKNGLVRVTLSKAMTLPLAKDAFSIICTGAGKDMTIINAYTTDNRTYDLITAYYNDNTYNLEITFPNGTRIDKDFISKYFCPALTFPKAVRDSETSASFAVVSDMSGTLYYGVAQNTPSKNRSVPLFTKEPTVDELMKLGQSQPMQQELNTIEVSELTPDMGYTFYYVAKGSDGTITPMKSVQIASKPDKIVDTGDNSIELFEVFEQINSDDFAGGEHYRFEATFKNATKVALTSDNFEITCPAQSGLSVGRVTTEDNQKYIIYLQPGTMIKSNNTYQVIATLPDNSLATKSVYADFKAPDITDMVNSTDEYGVTTFNFKASEGGKLYYKIFDDVEGTTAGKPSKEIFDNNTNLPIDIVNGENTFTLSGLTPGKWFCFATEDVNGYRILYYDYTKINAYVPSDPSTPEEPDELEIVSVSAQANSSNKAEILITFNRTDEEFAKLTGNDFSISNTSASKLLLTKKVLDDDKTKILLTIDNGVQLNVGTHILTVTINDKEIKYTFTTATNIPETVPDEE